MSTFFKDIDSMMVDRQEMRLHIKKVGSDLVILAVPNFKEEGKHITVSGPPDDLDAGFIDEIKKPVQLAAGKLTSNAAEVSAELEEEAEEENDDKKVKKPEAKKTAEPKKAEKKPAATKGGKKSKTDPNAAVTETNAEELMTTTESSDETTEETLAETKLEPIAAGTKEPEQQEVPVVEVEVEEETKPEPQPTPQPQEEEDGPDTEQIFEYFMVEGKRLFDDRKYKEAEDAYKKAVDLKPDDKKAKGELDQASKWVRAIEKLNK